MGDDFARYTYPCFEIGARVANRPVATPYYAMPAKTFDAMFDIRANRCEGGIARRTIGQHARDFARDIGKRGQLRDLVAPGIQRVVCNIRAPAVVEDELDIGASFRQSAGNGQLSAEEAEVKAEVEFLERADVRGKVIRLGEGVGHGVQDAAQADEFGMLDGFEIGFKANGVFGPAVGDDAFDDRTGLVGQFADKPGFVPPMGIIGRGFHENGARNPATLCGGQIVLEVERIPRERRESIRPRIRVVARVDQVLMRV